MADVKRTWVRPSAYEAKLHATAERQQSMIAGWTRVRVLVAVPGKGRLPHSTRQLSRLEGPEPLNQSIILLNSANSDSQKFANSGLIEVPDDNTLLPQAFGQNLTRLIFVTGKDEVCLGG